MFGRDQETPTVEGFASTTAYERATAPALTKDKPAAVAVAGVRCHDDGQSAVKAVVQAIYPTSPSDTSRFSPCRGAIPRIPAWRPSAQPNRSPPCSPLPLTPPITLDSRSRLCRCLSSRSPPDGMRELCERARAVGQGAEAAAPTGPCRRCAVPRRRALHQAACAEFRVLQARWFSCRRTRTGRLAEAARRLAGLRRHCG